MSFLNHIPKTIVQFIKIYLLAVLGFSIFRLILFFTEMNRIADLENQMDIFRAFIMGLRFDIVISGYILIFPYLVMSIFSYFNYKHQLVNKIILYFVFVLFTLAFLVCAVDIPYFNQFFARFSITAFKWLDTPEFVFKMVFQEKRYWAVLIPFFLFLFFFFKILKMILSVTFYQPVGNLYLKIFLSILGLGFIFLGIRGRIEEKSPIRIGTAYFSNNAFLNQLGLNPNFTLIRSLLDSYKEENQSIMLIDEQIAIKNVQQYLNISKPDSVYPLLRNIDFDTSNSEKINVVLVIMESMSAAKMERHGNTKKLTPFLDSISNKGYYFENAYTAGIHTFNGIFSTLFSYPALFRQHPMKESSMLKYNGIYKTLSDLGYSTIYFTTHDGQFDNVEGFLKGNDCQEVVSKPDYPAGKVKTTLGVPDDFMFEFAIPKLNILSEQDKPFFATFMTASDHGPYYIPEYFTPRNSDIQEQIVEYADYSIAKFIKLAAQQIWFKNTLFVFIADHGEPLDGRYDMSIDYNHSPLLFYAPELIRNPQTFSKMAGQIDVFPSIMGLLRLPYTNNTLGIDLFTESRPYILFSADDKYGVIDNEWFLIVRNDKTKSLYKYKLGDTQNYADKNPEIVNQMDNYAISNMQAFQYLINANKL